MVTTDTAQTITGYKTFNTTAKIINNYSLIIDDDEDYAQLRSGSLQLKYNNDDSPRFYCNSTLGFNSVTGGRIVPSIDYYQS
jgi:hypothetical protein